MSHQVDDCNCNHLCDDHFVSVDYKEYIKMRYDQTLLHALLDTGVKDWNKFREATELAEKNYRRKYN